GHGIGDVPCALHQALDLVQHAVDVVVDQAKNVLALGGDALGNVARAHLFGQQADAAHAVFQLIAEYIGPQNHQHQGQNHGGDDDAAEHGTQLDQGAQLVADHQGFAARQLGDADIAFGQGVDMLDLHFHRLSFGQIVQTGNFADIAHQGVVEFI